MTEVTEETMTDPDEAPANRTRRGVPRITEGAEKETTAIYSVESCFAIED